MLLKISDYHYDLPDERIAKHPVAQRDKSKLLIYKDGKISEDVFSEIANYVPSNSLLVYNNTRVICARLLFANMRGASIEIFCLEPLVPSDYALALSAVQRCEWKCLVGNLRKWKNEAFLCKKLKINDLEISLSAKIISTHENTHRILFEWDSATTVFSEILEMAGELPIPPYLHRKTERSDSIDYQTVYAKYEGSVAAPTAGLHFTETVFNSLKNKNIDNAHLTLHVGAGTFLPIKTENVLEHTMHAEVFTVKKSDIKKIIDKLGNIVAVGTTSLRTLESLYFIGCQLVGNEKNNAFFVAQNEPYEQNRTLAPAESLQNILNYLEENGLDSIDGRTQIMIRPSYRFRIVNALISNFHQPESTLLLLVAAFVGNRQWKRIYDYALTHDFRFLSYGDSSLLFGENV
ncbi:MAG: S-adenosylmethionine:tRNA ribosyltransferase-isomerase [Prevotellaceae bacterium]|jgi:S-adenosylmethionine:tRNA ribosyltransferase-isomerase|nr:S-adenosylmethionine:tRNA ribosyltransferase-isomerase [Prevotellaceae bacterium]